MQTLASNWRLNRRSRKGGQTSEVRCFNDLRFDGCCSSDLRAAIATSRSILRNRVSQLAEPAAECAFGLRATLRTPEVQSVSAANLLALYFRFGRSGSDLGANLGSVAGIRWWHGGLG